MSRGLTPARLTGRVGVLLSTLLLLTGCDVLGGGATIELDNEDVQLPRGADLHEVTISGAGARDSLDPATISAEVGDAVRFTVADRRTHALAFEPDSLSQPIREFLERTAQLRGPPLVNEGSAWVVSLADAPAGRYPFICRSHDERGVVAVDGQD